MSISQSAFAAMHARVLALGPTPAPKPSGASSAPATPGFQFRKPVPTNGWLKSAGSIFNDLQDNVAFWVLMISGGIALVSLVVMLVGFGFGNKGRGMSGLVAFVVSGAIVLLLGIYAGMFQAIYNSSQAA